MGKMKFKVTDNYGRESFVEYEWNEDDGIPNAETILENCEVCTCQLHEGCPYCEGDCLMFDNGYIEVLKDER